MLSLVIVVYQSKHDKNKKLHKPTFGYVFAGQDKLSINTSRLVSTCERGNAYNHNDIVFVLHKGKRHIFTGMMNNNHICMFELDKAQDKTDIKIY